MILLLLALLAPVFTAQETETLSKGELVGRPLVRAHKQDPFGGAGWIIIDAPADTIWKEIQDWKSYPQIYPYVVETVPLSRRNNEILIRQKLGYRFIYVTYHVVCSFDASNYEMTFKLAPNYPSDINGVQGYWKLYPQGDKTLVGYYAAVNVPEGIVNLIGSSLAKSLQWQLLNLPKYLKTWTKEKTNAAQRKNSQALCGRRYTWSPKRNYCH
jgi:ribosome-associated toxin RatA of RatAB toxin-antitoxin module